MVLGRPSSSALSTLPITCSRISTQPTTRHRQCGRAGRERHDVEARLLGYLGAQRGAVAFFRQHAFAFDDNKLGRANDSRFNVYVYYNSRRCSSKFKTNSPLKPDPALSSNWLECAKTLEASLSTKRFVVLLAMLTFRRVYGSSVGNTSDARSQVSKTLRRSSTQRGFVDKS